MADPQVMEFTQQLIIPNQSKATMNVLKPRDKKNAPPAAGAGASGAAGEITVEDFEMVFASTQPDTTLTAKTLLLRVSDISNALMDPKNEWSRKTKMLSELRGIVCSKTVANVLEILLKNASIWENCMVDGLKELRSMLAMEYAITSAFFIHHLGSRCIHLVEMMLGNLITMIQSSTLCVSSSGIVLLQYIAEYVQHSRIITKSSNYVLPGEMFAKSCRVRRGIFSMIGIVLSKWKLGIVTLNIKVIKQIITSALNDSDQYCRTIGKDSYIALYGNFPSHAEDIFNSLEKSRQQSLLEYIKDADSTASMNARIATKERERCQPKELHALEKKNKETKEEMELE